MQEILVILIIGAGAFFAFRHLKKSFQAKDCCSCDVMKAQNCAAAWCPLRSATPSAAGGGEEAPRHRTLCDLRPGESGTIVKLSGESTVYHRLLEMGVTPDSRVEVIRLAPLNDPMEVRIRGYHLLLRKSEAKAIEVAVAPPPPEEKTA